MKKLFISHSSKDKTFARKLKQNLLAYNLDVWLDENELKVGDSLMDRFVKEIETSAYVVVLISKDSNASTWVQKEVDIALSKDDITLLPILIEDCEVRSPVNKLKYLDFVNNDDFGYPFHLLLFSLELIDKIPTEPSVTNILFYDKDPEIDPSAKPCKVFKKGFLKPKYIYMSWEAKFFYDGLVFKRKWYRNSEVIPSLIREDTWDEIWRKKGTMTSTFIYNRYGHKKGEYSVRFYLKEGREERYIITGTFEIV